MVTFQVLPSDRGTCIGAEEGGRERERESKRGADKYAHTEREREKEREKETERARARERKREKKRKREKEGYQSLPVVTLAGRPVLTFQVLLGDRDTVSGGGTVFTDMGCTLSPPTGDLIMFLKYLFDLIRAHRGPYYVSESVSVWLDPCPPGTLLSFWVSVSLT